MVTATVATRREISLSDLAGAKRLRVTVDGSGDLTPAHSVSQAVDYFLDQMRIPRNDLPFMAFSRGLRLDSKSRLDDLPHEDSEWTIAPEVSAG